MGANLSALAKSFDVPLRDLVRELRRGYQSISECLEQTTAECDARAAELADCQRQLADAQRMIVDQELQMAQWANGQATESNRCAAHKEQMEAKQWELDQTIERLRLAEAENAQSKEWLQGQIDQNRQIHTEVERMSSDNDRSRNELAQLHAQLTSLTDTAVGAAELRGQLTAAQEELARLREQATNYPASAELTDQMAAANSQGQQLEATLAEQLAQLTKLADAAVDASDLHGQLKAAQRELARLREQTTNSPADDELRAELLAAKADRAQLEAVLAQQQAHMAALTDSALNAAELRGQWTATQEELVRLRTQSMGSPPETELREQLTAMTSERRQSEAILAQLQTQLAMLTDSAAEAHVARQELGDGGALETELREQLTAAKAERQRLDAVLVEQQSQISALTETVVNTAELRGQLTATQAEVSRLREQGSGKGEEVALQVELAGAKSERQQLENELDLVRQRAAELSESLDDQKRSIAAERQHWSEELRQLRRAVERQSEMVVRRARRAGSTDSGDANGTPSAGGQHADPVVDTLREQFEALQKSKSREAVSASKKDGVETRSYRVV